MPTARDQNATSPLYFRPPTAIVKLGGSLLDMPDLAERLSQLCSAWGTRPLLVVGGGPAADLVRDWDQRHQLGEVRSHWLALDSLELTSRLLVSLWPAAQISTMFEIESCWQAGRIPVIRSREWFESAEQASWSSPPQKWDSTTDTIAAWIASVSHSESIWLLKSVDTPASLAEASCQGLVDRQFTTWVPRTISVQWVNLRQMTRSVITP